MASLKLTHWCKFLLRVPQIELATLIWSGMELWSHPSPLLMTSVYWWMSIPLLSYTDTELLHAHNPPCWTFHPWSCMDIPANIHGRACSFLLMFPRGVLLPCCRAGTRQSAPCGNSSFSLPSGVGSSRVKLVHLAHVVHTPTHSGMPVSTSGAMRSQLWGEDPWSILLIFHDVWRYIICDIPFHTACPPIDLWFFSSPDMSLPSLRQDYQAPTKWHWFIYHSTIFVVLLLPWIGAGLSQTILEVSDVFINMFVPFCFSHSQDIEVNWHSWSSP